MVHIKRNRPNRNRFVAVCNPCQGRTAMFGTGHSRMRVWLAHPKPELRQPLLELSRQPPARGEATDEECGLLPDHQEQSLGREGELDIRTEPLARRRLKSSLIDVTIVRMEGSKNPATCALCARRLRCRFVGGTSTDLPGQHQPPGPYSILGIFIPCGAKFDVLRLLVARKDPLHPFVESLAERCQVLGGVEFGTPQLPWLQIGRSVRE